MSSPTTCLAVDIAIIGAGPAGLAAANRCIQGGASIVVLDGGKASNERQHQSPEDVAGGVGGAGLFSDGKLSFYPSGHALWALPGHRTLREGYGWLQSLTTDLVGSFPPFPEELLVADWQRATTEAKFHRKDYRSLVLSPQDSGTLIDRLSAPISHHIFPNHRVAKVGFTSGGFEIDLVGPGDRPHVVHAGRVIFCGGRFGPLMLHRVSPRPDTLFRRFEYGIRIEQRSHEFFLKDDAAVDTKLRFQDPSGKVEWRTFCCCRNGMILPVNAPPLFAFAGTAGKTSTTSNVGLNCRVLSPETFEELQPEIRAVLAGAVRPFTVSLETFCNAPADKPFYGRGLDRLLRSGLANLSSQFRVDDAVVHGPCIEGVGDYPKLSAQLETSVPGLYVAGDSTGIFRGLVAALISGFYAGAHAAQARLADPADITGTVRINRSPTAAMPVIFTAQSKQMFYCRDAICEYVLRRNKLPINPFRVFDYFLGDRVDRDTIRRGNNHLIRACDELWVFGPVADGVLFELVYAGHLNKPIRFFTIGTRAEDIRQIESLADVRFEPEVHAPQQTRDALMLELRRLVDGGIVKNTQPTLFDLV